MSALPARRPDLLPSEVDAMEADALDAIGRVSDPESAEKLLARVKVAAEAIRLSELGREYEQRWGRVRLLAERRYGELLGPAENQGKRSDLELVSANDKLTGADRQAQYEARKVASIPESVFAEYIQETEQPTRAGLLREANKLAPLMSSATPEWGTPQDLFDALDAEFGFDVDVCASPGLEKCKNYYSPADDGLAQNWAGTCWMNPPYGDAIVHWVRKAYESSKDGATVVCLVPARVDTGWWWDHCRHGEIRFLRGRLKFGGADTSAPFPSAVVVFGRAPRVVWWEWQ